MPQMTPITNQRQIELMTHLLRELRDVKTKLAKLLSIIPEESISEYKNQTEIKRAYLEAIKIYKPD